MKSRAMRVAVLVDLPLEQDAGGHVKAWQRFAEAARAERGRLDLTVFFLGPRETRESLAPNVRYWTIPAALGTKRLGLSQGGGHTDLARHNRRLARHLKGFDLIQGTSIFAFARTGLNVARQAEIPFLSSLHTDVVKFTRIYTAEVVEGILRGGLLSRFVLGRMNMAERSAAKMKRRVDDMLRASRHVFAANAEDLAYARKLVGEDRASLLRRGIDKERFAPKRRDRAWLNKKFGVPEDAVVCVFAGRVDETKRAGLAAETVRLLRDEGEKIHLFVAGRGQSEKEIETALGTDVTLAGALDQDTLARVMASAEFLLFPSLTETIGNVAIEAKASGLAVAVAASGAARQCVAVSGTDGLLISGDTAGDWASALRPLIKDRAARVKMSGAARGHIELSWPGWSDVLCEDLLPVWESCAGFTPPHPPA